MAYEKQTWNNDDPDTPITAARLDHIETGIESAHEAADIDLSGYATTSALNSGLSGKADTDHDHDGQYATPAQVNAKADTDHDHAIADVTGLQDALDAITGRLDALEEE